MIYIYIYIDLKISCCKYLRMISKMFWGNPGHSCWSFFGRRLWILSTFVALDAESAMASGSSCCLGRVGDLRFSVSTSSKENIFYLKHLFFAFGHPFLHPFLLVQMFNFVGQNLGLGWCPRKWWSEFWCSTPRLSWTAFWEMFPRGRSEEKDEQHREMLQKWPVGTR